MSRLASKLLVVFTAFPLISIWVWKECCQKCDFELNWEKKGLFLLKRLTFQWEIKTSHQKWALPIKSKRGKEGERELPKMLRFPNQNARSLGLIWFYEESRNYLQKHSPCQNTWQKGIWQKALLQCKPRCPRRHLPCCHHTWACWPPARQSSASTDASCISTSRI